MAAFDDKGKVCPQYGHAGADKQHGIGRCYECDKDFQGKTLAKPLEREKN